jgi:hypothetical protein
MRAREFLPEARNRQNDRADGFNAVESDPMVTTLAFPDMPGNNAYRAYRFAMAMANHELKHQDGPTSQLAVISAYTKGDEDIIRAAIKKTGERHIVVANKGSSETSDVNKTSPIAKIKKNRFGV